MLTKHVGPLDYVGGLPEAAQLVEEAWDLVADVFAAQQVREYASSLAAGRPPRQKLHPWVPGLHWHRTNVGTGFSGPLPAAVLYVVRDMLALNRIPDVLPTYRRAVAQRIRREGDRALWELRVAAQYAPVGIGAEWSAITDPSPGAPDVRIPAFAAEIQVKCLSRRHAIAADYPAIFGALDDALGQLSQRARRGSQGPGALVIVLPGANSLGEWDASDLFRNSMSMRLDTPEYRVVSAMLFVLEPVIEVRRDGHQLYGAPASHILNPNATWPWPEELPLVTNG